jgi:outer membrane protein
MRSIALLALLLPMPGVVSRAEAADVVPSPLGLDAALELARGRLPALRKARADTEATRARVRQAEAPRLPQVTARSTYSRATQNASRGFAGFDPPAPSADTEGELSASVSASQLLYDFGRTGGRIDAAEASVSAQQASEDATLRQAVLEVRNAFIDARAQKALLAVARETVGDRERHVTRVQAFVTAGMRPPIDVVQARANLADARVQLVEAENAADAARVRLDLALGLVDPNPYEVADEGPPAVPEEALTGNELLELAVAQSADARALQAQVQAQQATLEATRGNYWPSLGAQAALDESGPDPGALVWNYSFGLALTWPLYEGGLTDAQTRESDARILSARAALESLRQQLRLVVEQARLGVRSGLAAISAADEALVFAKERLALAEARYTNGVGTAIEVSDAQLSYANAGAQRVRAERTLAAARARLLDALGR